MVLRAASSPCSCEYSGFRLSQMCSSCDSSGTTRNVRQPRIFFDLRMSPNMWSPMYSTSLPLAPINSENTSHEPKRRRHTTCDLLALWTSTSTYGSNEAASLFLDLSAGTRYLHHFSLLPWYLQTVLPTAANISFPRGQRVNLVRPWLNLTAVYNVYTLSVVGVEQ